MANPIIGKSPSIQHLCRRLQDVAPSDLTVLLLGETGTGKGIAARALHQWSKRASRPYIHLNCGGLDSNLIDSELFGHEKGAFTGAHSRKPGKFEQAHGATLFLDEIGDMPLASQTRLLRVLQDRQLERLGGTQTISIDVRVVAATHQDLEALVKTGRFREDLYYRLSVFPLHVPSLRQRRQDIPLLAHHFIRHYAHTLGRDILGINPEALNRLQTQRWPGNIRQLEHRIQRAVVLADHGHIEVHHLVDDLPSAEDAPPHQVEHQPILTFEEYERRYLSHVLHHTDGVIHGKKGAALLLGIHPNTLRSRLDKLGLLHTRSREF